MSGKSQTKALQVRHGSLGKTQSLSHDTQTLSCCALAPCAVCPAWAEVGQK